jgi:excisionase family DNA binding protein
MSSIRIATADHQTIDLVENGFLTVAEAAKFLHLCRATVYTLMDSGAIPYAKFGKSRRVPRQALREYAERCLVGR